MKIQASLFALTGLFVMNMASANTALPTITPPTSAVVTTVTTTVTETNPHIIVQDDRTILISPRTGMRFSFDNPNKREVIFKIQEIQPANSQTVKRIVANNPALSAESQQQAQQRLLDLQ